MGQSKSKVKNAKIAIGSGEPDEGRAMGNVFMLMTALDYKYTSNPLTCTKDARNMQALVQACGVTNLYAMYDEQCTKDQVSGAIQALGQNMGPEDIFIYYYSGHGTQLQDQNGDEADGQDEAFCFVNPDGSISYESCMRDDDFAQLMTSVIPAETCCLVMTDCCHSGSICDFDDPGWAGREAICMSGCTDAQTSGDTGRGGIFTHSLLMAIDALQQVGKENYNVATVYNATLKFDEKIFASAQDISISMSPSASPQKMRWPLVPTQRYSAPMHQAADMMQGNVAGQIDQADSLGFNAGNAQYVQSDNVAAIQNVDADDFLNSLQGGGGCLAGICG